MLKEIFNKLFKKKKKYIHWSKNPFIPSDITTEGLNNYYEIMQDAERGIIKLPMVKSKE